MCLRWGGGGGLKPVHGTRCSAMLGGGPPASGALRESPAELCVWRLRPMSGAHEDRDSAPWLLLRCAGRSEGVDM